VSPLLPPLLEVVHRYNIPIPYLAMVLEGARFDLGMRCVETREDLLRYAVLVAGSVGIVMAHILGARSEEALAAACDLGVAMQLTNVLRDVGEDLRRDRVYLPRADLLRVGLSPDSLHTRNVTPALRSVMSELIEEARERYRHGMRGIPQLDPSARFAISLAATLYSRILDKIERRDFDVFSERAHLGNLEKWTLMMTAYLQQGQLETDR
jgi:phytoene synthase